MISISFPFFFTFSNQDKKTLSVEDLQTKLMEHHPNWKIPERRVKKFLKRHLSHSIDTSCADDDATLTTVSSSKGTPVKRLLKLFKVKKSKSTSNVPEAAPDGPSVPEEVSTPKAGAETKLEEQQVVDPEPESEPEPIQQSRSLEQAYSDDNDGKQNDCHCNEACSIM